MATHKRTNLATRVVGLLTAASGGRASLDAGSMSGIVDFALERLSLTLLSQVDDFGQPPDERVPLSWVRLLRLPVHPTHAESYDLLSRWQSLLSSLHAWQHRLVFLLMRSSGETRLYLGASSMLGTESSGSATAQLSQAMLSQMPGIELVAVEESAVPPEITVPMLDLRQVGAITGLPSRKGRSGDLLQTLDQLAFGIRGSANQEYDYALVVIAEPVPDESIARQIDALRSLGSRVHTWAKQSSSQGNSSTSGKNVGLNVTPFDVGWSAEYTTSKTESRSIVVEEIDKVAQYCEQLTDRHVERLQRGRNLGFWSTSVYVLGADAGTVTTVMGMLRSVYAGDQSFLEPIRVHLLKPRSHASDWVKSFRPIPLPRELAKAETLHAGGVQVWKPLAPADSFVATPLNTEELSIVTSLPRRDVPGLRFVRNAVRFATNPSPVPANARPIHLGRVMDTGVVLNTEYVFDLNTLVRHGLVTGLTGMGKSTTCRRLLDAAVSADLPVLIVEPVKEEYVRWAIAHNARAPKAQRFQIYMPGAVEIDQTPVQLLHLNPFQPAGVGPTVDLGSRFERFVAILTASLPMADVLPLLLEESIFRYLQDQIAVGFADGDVQPPKEYPRLEGVIAQARAVIDARGHERQVKDNLVAAIETRINALTRGKRGSVFNVEHSTPFDELFDRPAVVNLSRISDNRDKALIMALLVTALYEYRISRYLADPAYRGQADQNRMCHLTVIEEAHRLLANPRPGFSTIGDPQGLVAGMFSEMLSEIRAYGQGLLLVDQAPARLIPDAVKNTNLKIVHRLVASDDRAAMATSMALRPDQESIITVLQTGEAIVSGDLDDAALWVSVYR